MRRRRIKEFCFREGTAGMVTSFTVVPPLDVEAVREDFPILRNRAAAWDCGYDAVFDDIVSCLIYGWPVELGTNAFGGGHAVVATTAYQFGGAWRLAGPNSWGTSYSSWDRPGFWSFPEQQISLGLSDFGAFGIQASVIDPDDVPA